MTAEDISKIITAMTGLVGVILAGIALAYNYRSQASAAKTEFVKRKHDAIASILVVLHEFVEATSGMTMYAQFAYEHHWTSDEHEKNLSESIRSFHDKRFAFQKVRMINSVYFPVKVLESLIDFENKSFQFYIACPPSLAMTEATYNAIDPALAIVSKSFEDATNAIRESIGTDAISKELQEIISGSTLKSLGLTKEKWEMLLRIAGTTNPSKQLVDILLAILNNRRS